MKKIYLIGDSIRFGATGSPGYGVFVTEKLAGEAEVYAPKVNCAFCQHTFRYLHEWAASAPKEEIDVVHWNNGLWDVLRLLGDDPFTDLDYYGVIRLPNLGISYSKITFSVSLKFGNIRFKIKISDFQASLVVVKASP